MEQFLKFVDCSDKRRSKIAQMITETFETHAIPLGDCRHKVMTMRQACQANAIVRKQ